MGAYNLHYVASKPPQRRAKNSKLADHFLTGISEPWTLLFIYGWLWSVWGWIVQLSIMEFVRPIGGKHHTHIRGAMGGSQLKIKFNSALFRKFVFSRSTCAVIYTHQLFMINKIIRYEWVLVSLFGSWHFLILFLSGGMGRSWQEWTCNYWKDTRGDFP